MNMRVFMVSVTLAALAAVSCRADGPPWPPPGGFTEWGGIFVPGVSVIPTNGCFHGEPLTFTAIAAGGRGGIYDWRCGNHSQTTTNGTAQIPADHKGKPKTLIVTFTPDDYPNASASGSASLGYCKRFDPPPEEEEEEEEHDDCNHHTHWWCCKCGAYDIPDPGSFPHDCSLGTEGGEDPGGGTNAPPQDITSYLGTVPREIWHTHSNANAYVMFFPARRWANSGGNGGYGGTNAPPYVCEGEDCDDGIHSHSCCEHSHGGNTPYYGQCCPCPEHNPGSGDGSGGGTTNGPLRYVTSYGLIVSTNPPPNTVALGNVSGGIPIPDGTPVWVTGLNASQTLGDRWARFTWDEDGQTRTRDYTFTAIGMRLFPDRVGNGDPQANANLDLGYKDPTAEWVIPAGGGLRPMFLTTYTMLPGTLTFTLDGTPGAFRVWSGSTTNSTLLFGCPGVATNGNPHTITTQLGAVWVEAVSNGTATFTARFQGTGVASNYNVVRSFPIRAETRIRADTNRDGVLSEADDPGNLWSIERGALIPPTMTPWNNTPLPYAPLTAPISVDTRGLTNGTTFHLAVEPSAKKDYLVLFDAAGQQLYWNNNGRISLGEGVLTNLHAASWAARKCDTADFPDAFDLRLEITPPGGTPAHWGSVRLKIAPLILPPECNPAETVYSTREFKDANGNDIITGLKVVPVPGNIQWTQDMAKFTKVQFNTLGATDVALDLGYVRADNPQNPTTYYYCSDTLTKELSEQTPMLRTVWDVGGEGGNIMATPPLGTNAPYGKIMIGTKKPASKEFWERQGIQPIIDIDTSWLVVGHVDELFMWISPTDVLYADPWIAANLSHTMIANGGGIATLWCGYDSADTTNTIAGVVIDNNKITRLLTPLNATTNQAGIQCEYPTPLFNVGDYLRVGDEVLRVLGINLPNGYVVARAQAGRPATVHATNDVIYALSPLMVKNLIGTNSVVSKIRMARRQLRQGLDSYSSAVTFTAVPVLFNNGRPGYNPEHFAACTANLANSLVVNKGNASVYYPDPGADVFRMYFTNSVPGAVAVNVWNFYHCGYGEIHCGTATRRILQHEPPWWERNEVKTKWENEK